MPSRAESEITKLADHLLQLETRYPRHVALAHLLAGLGGSGVLQPLPLFVGWKEAGIPRRTFYAWVAAGRLKASKFGNTLKASRADVERLWDENLVKAAAPEAAPTSIKPRRMRKTDAERADAEKLEAAIGAEFGARRASR